MLNLVSNAKEYKHGMLHWSKRSIETGYAQQLEICGEKKPQTNRRET